MQVMWERIDSKHKDSGEEYLEGNLRRAKVLGGWFVLWRDISSGKDSGLTSAGMVFYPDPKH